MRTVSEVDPRFLKIMAANLTYWTTVVRAHEEPAYSQLDPERENLRQGVAFGLAHPDTWEAAVQLLMALMDYLESRGGWHTWSPWLEKALATCPAEQPHWRGKLACRLGFFYRLDGRYTEALALHREACQIAEGIGDHAEVGWATLGMADEYYYLHDQVEAEHHARSALRAFEAAGVTGPRVRAAYSLLGMLATERGEYAQAEVAYQEALSPAWGADPVRKRVQNLMNRTIALRYAGRLAEAHTCIEEIFALLPKISSALMQMEAQNLAGFVYFAEQDWAAAEQAFRAMDAGYLRRFGHVSLLAEQANNLGNVALKYQAFGAAAEQLAYAAGLFRELKDDINLGNTLGDWGTACLGLGNPAQACALWGEALAVLQKYPDHAWASHRRQAIQVTYEKLGCPAPTE
ncbi:MAG: tetratricopeptide repeat protein [Anaerolineales bacterium]|nr:tetratricopeptide repeat protein [Anaerolineales bacterium]